MKIPCPLILVCLPCFCAVAGNPLAIVETDFNQTSGAELAVVGTPTGFEALPLRAPTHVTGSSSSIMAGSEPIGTLQAPYALVKFEGGEVQKGARNAAILWQLSDLGLAAGWFELSYHLTPLDAKLYGARMRVEFVGEDGKPLKIDPPLHPKDYPVQAYLQGNKLVSGRKSIVFSQGATHLVKLSLDLDAKVWSATVDETLLVDNEPFPPAMVAAASNLRIGSVSFGGSLGAGDKANSESFALSEVRLLRLK